MEINKPRFATASASAKWFHRTIARRTWSRKRNTMSETLMRARMGLQELIGEIVLLPGDFSLDRQRRNVVNMVSLVG